MTGPRIGSLCTGTGALDLAVMDVLGGSMAWHCQYEPPDKEGREDKHQYAARILAHHWPDVPNHGDITAIDWAAIEPVDIITAGWPCQDMSLAGKGAGLIKGTRSGLWFYVFKVIEAQAAMRKPGEPGPLIFLENVRGLLSAKTHCDLEFCPWCMAEIDPEHYLRALGVVLGDLAGLGFDAEWQVVRASDVGAAHQRERTFILAWPADSPRPGLEGPWLRGRPASSDRIASDADRVGHERDGAAGQSQERHAAGTGRPVAHPESVGTGEPADKAFPIAEGRHARPVPGRRGGGAASDASGDGRNPRRAESAGILRGPDAALGGSAVPADTDCDAVRQQPVPEPRGCCEAVAGLDREAPADSARLGDQDQPRDDVEAQFIAEPGTGDRADLGHRAERADQPGGSAEIVAWGAYEPAIRRWEHILGRPAPWPTEPDSDGKHRLSPAFVEWLMGLPAGHVTDVPAAPGMSLAGVRNARLKALGNGVVRQQAAHALRLLLDRVSSEVAA